MHHHSGTFSYDCVKVCSPAIFETCFSYDKDGGGGLWEIVSPGSISKTVRCRKLIRGRDIG